MKTFSDANSLKFLSIESMFWFVIIFYFFLIFHVAKKLAQIRDLANIKKLHS